MHGMIGLVHVGYQPASFDRAWANTAGDMMLLRQLGVSQGHQLVELMLNGVVFGGTFARHPELTILIAECGLYWFEGAVDHMDSRDARRQPEARRYMGEYPFELSPSEFVHRNVRTTPLPRLHQSRRRLLETYPECVAFSTDYNHNEGCGTPTAYHAGLLEGLDEKLVTAFMGDNIADCYARMGDPLPGTQLTIAAIGRARGRRHPGSPAPPARRAHRSSIRGSRCSSRARACR
jgi:predicted TIM-barrel fold metal-dependent hydrolase